MSSTISQDTVPPQVSSPPMIPIAQNNTIVLDVDNLLVNWPTYVINYTPDQPGPLKILLRLKDITKRAQEDDGDTDISESESENEKIRATVVGKEQRAKGANITLHLHSCDEDSDDDKTLTVDAIPVTLHGIPKDIISPRPKFFDDDKPWPPVRPRALRPIYNNEPISRFAVLKTFVAPVKVIDDDENCV